MVRTSLTGIMWIFTYFLSILGIVLFYKLGCIISIELTWYYHLRIGPYFVIHYLVFSAIDINFYQTVFYIQILKQLMNRLGIQNLSSYVIVALCWCINSMLVDDTYLRLETPSYYLLLSYLYNYGINFLSVYTELLLDFHVCPR